MVQVELYADGINDNSSVRQKMKRIRQLENVLKGYVYSTTVPDAQPAINYTPRVIPYFSNIAVPLEEAHILWQK